LASNANSVAVFSLSANLRRPMASLCFPISASFRLHLLDAHFEPTGQHGEFSAQQILVGLDFGSRTWSQGFHPLHGEAYGARVHPAE
jgi:hypothetical protein